MVARQPLADMGMAIVLRQFSTHSPETKLLISVQAFAMATIT
jgi:hypothetical protein